MSFRSCRSRLLFYLSACLVCFCMTTAEARAATLPKLTFQQYRLPNGLRVILSPDKSVPVVAVCVTYDVGARNEAVGHAGFAHLFEHLMFEGSAHVRSGQHLRLIKWAGGTANGTTSADRTHYYEALPREQLKLALFLEADRMFSLRLNQETFVSARKIVEAEKRERHDRRAYDPVAMALAKMAFTKFANTHDAIGTVDDLESATLEEARRFYATYYTPRNAVLAVSGNFDTAQAKAMIAQYFSAAGAKTTDAPLSVDDAEPLDKPIPPGMQWASLNMTRVALPRYYLAFRIPPRTHPDYPALVMLSDILGDGHESRCWRGLIKTGSAVEESVVCSGRRGPALFTFMAQSGQRHTNFKQIVQGAGKEIRQILQTGVTEKELTRVRSEERMRAISSRSTTLLRCEMLADAAVCQKDPDQVNVQPAALQAVTASDILRVARKYLTRSNCVQLFAR